MNSVSSHAPPPPRGSSAAPTVPRRRARLVVAGGLLAWALAAAAGFGAMERYALTAEVASAAPETWPAPSALARDPDRMTLVVFIHPRCPCTRATLDELAAFHTKAGDRLRLIVVVWQPEGRRTDWEHSATIAQARTLRHARVVIDSSGSETRCFSASISGESYLFDAGGKLRFHGGITAGRGRTGPNPGTGSLESLVQTGRATITDTAVYGCSLRTKTCDTPSPMCPP